MKRISDLFLAIFFSVLFSVPILLIALLIKMTSKGSVLYWSDRIGRNNVIFKMPKFRSMKVDCDPCVHKTYVTKLIKGENDSINKGTCEQPVYKINDDSRITWFGRFLRKSSIDELPQFYNVLKGDMSLVGPRQPIPYECEQYKRWHCRRVLEVKPGITGLWQVSGRSDLTFDEMALLDIYYIENWSPALDAKILLQTIPRVIFGNGAY